MAHRRRRPCRSGGAATTPLRRFNGGCAARGGGGKRRRRRRTAACRPSRELGSRRPARAGARRPARSAARAASVEAGDRGESHRTGTSRAPRRRRRRRRRRRGDARAAVASIGRAMKRRGGRRAREGALSRTEPPPRTPRVAWPDAAGARPPGAAFAPGRRAMRVCVRRCARGGEAPGGPTGPDTCATRSVSKEVLGFDDALFETSASFDENASRDNLDDATPVSGFIILNESIIPLVENVFRDRRLAEPRFSLGVTSALALIHRSRRTSSRASTHTHTNYNMSGRGKGKTGKKML